MTSALLFLHLVAFAAYLGAGFAQLRFLKRSETSAPAVRDELEQLAALTVTRIELPAIFVAMATGAVFLVRAPYYLHEGWIHGKLAAVLLLAVLSHLEMFNARTIVKLRAAGGNDDAIAARKKRHALFGALGSLLVVVLLAMVTFVRLRGS